MTIHTYIDGNTAVCCIKSEENIEYSQCRSIRLELLGPDYYCISSVKLRLHHVRLFPDPRLLLFCARARARVCVVIPFILNVRFVDVPAGVTQKEGHTGFLIHLPSAVLALIFLARRIQPLAVPFPRRP